MEGAQADPHVVLALTGDYTYVEAEWNTEPETDPAYGVPTSYYTAVQLLCRAEVVDDPDEKAAILATQLDHFEPSDSVRVPPTTDIASDRRQLPGIRGLRLHLEGVRAKMKYGGNKPPEHRRVIADQLAERGRPDGLRSRVQPAPPPRLVQKGGGPRISIAPVCMAASRILSKSTGIGWLPSGAGSLAIRKNASPVPGVWMVRRRASARSP